MSQQSVAKVRRFSVATEYFMSRQNWPRQVEIMSRQSLLRKGNSCCDRVVKHGENLCRD